MVVDAAFKNLINSCCPIDEVLVTTQQEYYNEPIHKDRKVKDIIKENGKLILLTDE